MNVYFLKYFICLIVNLRRYKNDDQIKYSKQVSKTYKFHETRLLIVESVCVPAIVECRYI